MLMVAYMFRLMYAVTSPDCITLCHFDIGLFSYRLISCVFAGIVLTCQILKVALNKLSKKNT